MPEELLVAVDRLLADAAMHEATCYLLGGVMLEAEVGDAERREPRIE